MRIIKRDRFVIAGTEVFHPACISEIPRSKLHRVARRALEVSREKDSIRFELEAAKETLRRVHEAEKVRVAATRVEWEWQRSLYKDAQTDLEATRRERDQLSAALQSARAELALQRAMGSTVRAEPVSEEKQDTRDPLEVRASLLELD